MSWGQGEKSKALQTEKTAKVQNSDEHSIACSYSNNVFYIISYILLKFLGQKQNKPKKHLQEATARAQQEWKMSEIITLGRSLNFLKASASVCNMQYLLFPVSLRYFDDR